MQIAGFQALSLLDYPGVISAIVFTQGCVFRCPYCHNPELIPCVTFSKGPTADDVLVQLRKHRHMVEAVCITGGEPTLQHDLPEYIRAIKQERFLVKLDTNGIHPAMMQQLFDEGLLDYVAMDLKHTWDAYERVIGVEKTHLTERCRDTFQRIQQSGVPHEFRTTICPGLHTEEDIVRIGLQLAPGERYILQPIRYGKTLDTTLQPAPPLDVHRIIDTLRQERPDLDVSVRG